MLIERVEKRVPEGIKRLGVLGTTAKPMPETHFRHVHMPVRFDRLRSAVLDDAKGEMQGCLFGREKLNIPPFQGLNLRRMVRSLGGQLFKNGLEQDMLMQVIPELDQRAVEQRRVAGVQTPYALLELEPLLLEILGIHGIRT